MFLNNIDGAQVNESEIYTKCIYNVTLHLRLKPWACSIASTISLWSSWLNIEGDGLSAINDFFLNLLFLIFKRYKLLPSLKIVDKIKNG